MLNNTEHSERGEAGYYYCLDCKPNWTLIGEFNERYFLVHDKTSNKYLIGDINGHADTIYEFSKKPDYDPIGVHEEPPNDDPRWPESFGWYNKWKDDREKFMFEPNTAYNLVVAFTESGWTQKKNGDLFFHIVNNAGLLIQAHEARLADLHSEPVGE